MRWQRYLHTVKIILFVILNLAVIMTALHGLMETFDRHGVTYGDPRFYDRSCAPPVRPSPWSELAAWVWILILPPSPHYMPGPHSPGVPCEYYLFLTGDEAIESCLAQLSRYPDNRFLVPNRHRVPNRYRGKSLMVICRRNVEGAETRVELNIDDGHRHALWKREVPKWEIGCALRRALQDCASGMIEEAREECGFWDWMGEVHVTFEVSEDPEFEN
jgi:hypothetical protein